MSEAHRIAEYCANKSLPTRSEYRVPCPYHGGTDNNMVISEGSTGRTLFHCHSHGCSFKQIADSLPSYLWDNGAAIPARQTFHKVAPKPLTLRVKDDSKTYDFAERMWINSQHEDRTDHAYAVRKKFQPCSNVKIGHLPHRFGPLSEGDRVLVIKMQDEQGIFTGVQLINEAGDRCFAGGQGMLILDNEWWTKATRFHVVEGFATGVACREIYQGEDDVAVVAFSLGNLEKVKSLLSARLKQERGFTPDITVHDEPEGIDLWDILHDEAKRARSAELQQEAEGWKPLLSQYRF